MDSILLDTSFCIRLMKADEQLHQNALDYFQYFLENKVDIFLSSIVVAEYSVKDDAKNLPVKMMQVIPFDFFDAEIAGEFHAILLKNKEHLQQLDRLVIKDDCKLLAQIYNRGINAYITKDRRSFSQIIEPIITEKEYSLELLDLEIPLKTHLSRLF